jgi:hypothetical protein
MSAFLSRVVLTAALTCAAAAFAHEPPPAGSESNVVVTGERGREQEISDFVAALASAPSNGQLARFEDRICPAAFGLSGPLREQVVTRMRRVSEAAGLRLAGEGCRPNVLLMVTRDKRAFVQALAARYPQYFGDDHENSARAVARQPGPASAWHARESVNADGQALTRQGGFAVNRTTRGQSRIAHSARPVFTTAAVVIEREALTGLSTTQLADYALMRALAQTDPSRLPASSPATILAVLEAPMGTELPLTLTRWDLGFLRGLYASRANLHANAQRGEIRDGVREALDGAEERGN